MEISVGIGVLTYAGIELLPAACLAEIGHP